MKILHVLGKLDRGGVETWLVQVLRRIDRSEYQMDFVVHTAESGAYDDEVRALGSKIIPCLSPSNPIKYAINFTRLLRQHGPYDVVHSHVHHFSGYVLMLSALYGVPVRIAHSHTGAVDRCLTFRRKAYLDLMHRMMKRYMTRGIMVSGLAGDSIMPEWKQDPRWQLCPCGIDYEPFTKKVDRTSLRAQLGIPSAARVIGHVGRFVEVKNHRFLLEVADELVRINPGIVFLLVGDGALREDIQTAVVQRGLSEHFVFTGLRADVPKLLNGAMDAFVLPSIYEGLPIALLEAQFAGLPCVASDTITAEVEFVPGAVTWLSLSSPPQTWALAINEALRCRLPDGLSAGLARFSIENSVRQLVGFYHPH